MTEHRNSLYVVVILIALLGVTLSCCCGMLGGAMAGGWQARKIARRVVRQKPVQVVTPEARIWPRVAPTPPATPERRRPPTVQPLPKGMVPEEFLKAGYPGGALLLDVRPSSPAEEAGLRAGDIIVAVDEEDVTPNMTLSNLIHKYKPGDAVEIRYWRLGDEGSVAGTLGTTPGKETLAYLGVDYSPVGVPPGLKPE